MRVDPDRHPAVFVDHHGAGATARRVDHVAQPCALGDHERAAVSLLDLVRVRAVRSIAGEADRVVGQRYEEAQMVALALAVTLSDFSSFSIRSR